MNITDLETNYFIFKIVYNVDGNYLYLLSLINIWNAEYLESNFLKTITV